LARFFPRILPRVTAELYRPHAGQQLPGKRPGFVHGDPRARIPATCASIEAQLDGPLLPWQGEGDLFIAPFPRPGEESAALCDFLETLHRDLAVLLYEFGTPVFANLTIGDEALVFLPASRAAALLRASVWAERRPGARGSFQNRTYLSLALDHQRALSVLAAHVRYPAPLAELRFDGELDLSEPQQIAAWIADASARQVRPAPERVHLPWWGANSFPAWQANRQLAKVWPREWRGVQVQFACGHRYLRMPAEEYWAAFRASGAMRRWFVGKPKA